MFIYHHLSERYISIFPTKQMIRLQTVSKNPQIFQTAVLLYSALHAEHTGLEQQAGLEPFIGLVSAHALYLI